MTSKDKTREKLVGSMRKTKAAAGIESDNTETVTEAGAAVVEEKVVDTVTEAKAAKPAAQSAKRNVKSSRPARDSVDSYQSGRRVWPD